MVLLLAKLEDSPTENSFALRRYLGINAKQYNSHDLNHLSFF